MQTHDRTIHFARAAALAIALSIPTVSTLPTTAYADNESAGTIAPPYQAAENDKSPSALCGPAVSAKSDVVDAGRQQDELARKIYRPGVSDR